LDCPGLRIEEKRVGKGRHDGVGRAGVSKKLRKGVPVDSRCQNSRFVQRGRQSPWRIACGRRHRDSVRMNLRGAIRKGVRQPERELAQYVVARGDASATLQRFCQCAVGGLTPGRSGDRSPKVLHLGLVLPASGSAERSLHVGVRDTLQARFVSLPGPSGAEKLCR
jgi:hypothetical protein